MSQGALPVDAQRQAFARGRLGRLDRETGAAITSAAGDIVLVIDADGVICDMAIASADLRSDGVEAWLDHRWIDTVTVDSRHKVEELLREGRADATGHWREVNQVSPKRNALIMRYLVLSAGADGLLIAIGRDDRAISSLQQRVLEAQQAMERDYARLRDAESRYRLLCQISGEGIIVVDATSRRILEANPAAERQTGLTTARMVGEPFVRLFDSRSQDDAASLLATALTAARANTSTAKLSMQGREIDAAASPFRHDRATHCLVRLSPSDLFLQERTDDSGHVHAVIECMPEALVVTDTALRIMTAMCRPRSRSSASR
jgi:transcriptional regulator PpsR